MKARMIFMKTILSILLILGGSIEIFSQTEMKYITVGLNSAGDVVISKSKSKNISDTKIEGIAVSTSRDREPVYRVPIGEKDKNLTIAVYGTAMSKKGDLAFTGEGFVIRVLDIILSNDKIITVNLQTNGNKIDYISNKSEEIPSFSFAFDPPNATDPSYIFKLKRTKLLAQKKITISLDTKNGTMNFADNDSKGNYSIEITKINADGSEETFTNAEISSKKANRFQINFINWKQICLKNDIDGKGYANDKCNTIK
jgi:hypothetical protein